MKKQLAVLLAAIMLTACAEAPEEVQRENSILDNAETVTQTAPSSLSKVSEVSETALEYLTLDEIREQLENDRTDNSGNVILKNVRIGEGNAMPSYTVRRRFENYKQIGELVSYCFGEDMDEHPERIVSYPHNGIEMYPGTDCPGSYSYIPQDGDPMTCIMTDVCQGFSVSSVKGTVRYVDSPENELVKDYRFFMGDEVDDSAYVMTDGRELKVSDAVRNIEELFNEHISQLVDGELVYSVRELAVYKYPDGTHGFAYDMEYRDKGGNMFASCLMLTNDVEAFEEETAPWIPESDCHGRIIDSKMSPFAYIDDFPLPDKIKDSGEKLISLKCAVGIISSKLASKKVYDLDDAALEYVYILPPKRGYANRDPQGGLVDVSVSQYQHDPSMNAEVRPYWVFCNTELNNTQQAIGGGCVLVDALTGEIYVA